MTSFKPSPANHPHFLEISPRLALSSGIGWNRGGSAR